MASLVQTNHPLDQNVIIRANGLPLFGQLNVPVDAMGMIIFAHGSGSSRWSPRNQAVASRLVQAGFGTLLLDLLQPREAVERVAVFDIELLSSRLLEAVRWLERLPETSTLRMGMFGASTGAAAALVAAAREPGKIHAVVSRGGRPDLAGSSLDLVKAPTLLIVGGRDLPVIELNQQALLQLRCPKDLVVIPGASHLFPEPGALEEVARLAADWFRTHLAD
jgi:putative phosphoribosyl transferase